jgi:hypothetical protein
LKLISESDCGKLETFSSRDNSQAKSKSRCIVYASDDGILTCMLFSMAHSGDLKEHGYDPLLYGLYHEHDDKSDRSSRLSRFKRTSEQ